ncbi:MAG: uracil-DNA glycosylase [Pirellulaceae bacterium]|jgi:uracil-DNA glycosylase
MSTQRSFTLQDENTIAAADFAADLPSCWDRWCREQFSEPYFGELVKFIKKERQTETVFPPSEDVFNAFRYTPLDEVRVVILGQDPYHDDDQAHGLCFSVRPEVKTPPSLANIYKELHADLGVPIPSHGCLTSWAKQGILLLNTVLTVRAHQANSHRKKGWEVFTDAVISRVNEKTDSVVFVLWGKPAQKKRELIDETRHSVLESVHPSPLSARRGFFDSRPFSQINKILNDREFSEIDWSISDIA